MKGAGWYRDRVIFMKQREQPEGAAGAIGEDFDDVGIIWCRISEPKGGERIQWSSLQSSIDCNIRLRGNFGVRAVDRLRDENTGAVYLILGETPDDDDGTDQILMCRKFTEQKSETIP